MDATGMRVGHRVAWWAGGIATLTIAVVTLLRVGDHRLSSILADWSAGSVTPSSTELVQQPAEIPPPLPGGDSSVSPTPKALLLGGTKTGARPEDALAFLGVERRNPQTYRVGSLLPNGARIAAIGVDHVILQRDGKTLRLNVSRDTTLAGRDPPARGGALDSVGGPSPHSSRLTNSNEAVTTVIRPSPVFDDAGRFVAYALQPGTDAEAFARLGLRPGDRLVSVNGVPLANVSEAAQALQTLAAGSTLRATVQRDGQPLALQLGGQVPLEVTSPAPAVEAAE